MPHQLLTTPARSSTLHWWQRGVIYHIYPRSFQDSNGDGIGDVQGIITRLDYLTWLGVDALWLSPIFPSPMVDFGYDIADYCAVDPLFGDLETFERLLEQAHRRGLKVLLDFVPNHTSDTHPWFVEARSSRTSRKREGISGAIPRQMEALPTIGRATLVAQPGRLISTRGSITCISSMPGCLS